MDESSSGTSDPGKCREKERERRRHKTEWKDENDRDGNR